MNEYYEFMNIERIDFYQMDRNDLSYVIGKIRVARKVVCKDKSVRCEGYARLIAFILN